MQSSNLPLVSAEPTVQVAGPETHPCFNKRASHHFGRIHLPVAPRCNILCGYCNRRFDCANESRPGVTSRVLTPSHAVEWAEAQIGQDDRITVVGIAGPGDALANEETFETLRLVNSRLPHLTLCLSTNGLVLPEKVELLADLGVTNLTVTVNAVDPAVAAKVYRMVRYGRRRYYGLEAADLLVGQQLRGIAAATERNILVKTNSVLIPGVNDHHMLEVARRVGDLGVYIMNVMPLIPMASMTHLRPPTEAELLTVRGRCSGFVRQMSHCKQCRADAVGMLSQNEPCGREKATDPSALLVAVASKGNRAVDQHFGHARGFFIYRLNTATGTYDLVEFRDTHTYCVGPDECADAGASLEDTVGQLSDCWALVCARIGQRPREAFEEAGLEVVETTGTVHAALNHVLQGWDG
ncbi:MAG: nitrogenase cofactor biosynthesis protein NifB [Anaerolineae bacterium]